MVWDEGGPSTAQQLCLLCSLFYLTDPLISSDGHVTSQAMRIYNYSELAVSN